MSLPGCGSKGPSSAPKPPVAKTEEEKKTERSIHTGSGKVIMYSPIEEGHAKLWSAQYQWATIEYYDEDDFGGRMRNVQGTFFQGDAVSTFTAELAEAEKATKTLKLSGLVTVTSIKDKSKLTCKSVTYFANKEIIEAAGDISLDSPSYTMTGLQKVMTNPDLTIVATPEYFKKTDGK